MKGCLKRAGCLVVILLVFCVLWYWYVQAGRPTLTVTTMPAGTATTAPSAASGWQPLTAADAERGRVAVQSLGQRSGPVFANMTPAEAASYIFTVVAKQLPPTAKNVEAAVIGDRLYVRADVELKDFGGAKALGPVGMLLGDRDSVRLGGNIHMLKPGLGEFLVQEVKLGRIDVPRTLIPRLLGQMKRKPVVGISPNGLPMVMPSYISDVRISNGRIILYKSVR
ncbi:MAG: hypothetical protein M3P00_09845 [Gemmatimonadota bacterium]|nr:hypothetical protein [Gemmatimonadota bacterium]